MKKLFLLIGLLSSPASATVLIDSATASGPPAGGAHDWNMTIGTGLNRALVIGCENNQVPPGISTPSIAGSTFTVVVTTANGLDRASLWVATNPASGSTAIHVQTGSGGSGCGAISFENVNISSPINTTAVALNISSVTWTTTASTTMLVDVIGEGTNSTVGTPGSGQTLQWSNSNAGGFTAQMGSTKDGGAAGSKTMSWTLSATLYAMAAAAVNTSTGAPEVTSISPLTKGINEGSFVLTVNGTNFMSGSSVTWNGANRATTFVNSTQLTAVILSTDIATIGSYQIRVVSTDTARSNILSFAVTGDITYAWVTDGGYKAVEDDLYGTLNPSTVTNTRIWNGTTVTPFQAKNEINGFALVLENNSVVNSTNVRVAYPVLTSTSGYVISSTPAATSALYDWNNRPIELYLVRYLQILGISMLGYDHSYDERQLPTRFQATYTGNGVRTGDWTTRADHDKYYPEIMVPMEAVTGSTFTVPSSSSQIVWFDIYVPKNAPAGQYTGTINVYEGAQVSTSIPINLMVYPFTMPDVPPAHAWTALDGTAINKRHFAYEFAPYGGITSSMTVTHIHYMHELWRHGVIPMADSYNGGCDAAIYSGPCPVGEMSLNGTLYSPATGYANAPGILSGVPLYSMFSFGSWQNSTYWPNTYAATCSNANLWVNWFRSHSPKTDYWWYVEDEPATFANANIWSTWISTCPPPGNALPTYVTGDIVRISTQAPNLTHPSTTIGITTMEDHRRVLNDIRTSGTKRSDYYNGERPWTGCSTTDCDGIEWRVKMWMQYKMGWDNYFFWISNYWNNFQGSGGDTDLFHRAHTFGYATSTSTVFGETGFNYTNGDGVLLYPGTDTSFPADSYGIDCPLPSYRLKMFRRGINDYSYLKMAAQYDPKAVNQIVQQMIPKVLWEYGVEEPADPTYQHTGQSWTDDPNQWELARERLANIIANHR